MLVVVAVEVEVEVVVVAGAGVVEYMLVHVIQAGGFGRLQHGSMVVWFGSLVLSHSSMANW